MPTITVDEDHLRFIIGMFYNQDNYGPNCDNCPWETKCLTYPDDITCEQVLLDQFGMKTKEKTDADSNG